jgi:hypothetical protein
MTVASVSSWQADAGTVVVSSRVRTFVVI